MELLVLKELGFILYVDHPHNFFFHYVNALNAGQEIAQRAWNFLNDAMRTNICLRYKPENIATAAIYLAARVLQMKLPDNPPWYDLFDTDKKRKSFL
jgi:transcription initiation factor TFIIIB Brf1 subunit/transcription initiation factor TFIIB